MRLSTTTDSEAGDDSGVAPQPPSSPKPHVGLGPGFPEKGPWVSFYGTAAQMGDLAKVAATLPRDQHRRRSRHGNFTDAQLKTLKAGGKNRVISYMNVGACELYRDYWSKAPAGFVPCGTNRARTSDRTTAIPTRRG